jgi:hypothetical protein
MVIALFILTLIGIVLPILIGLYSLIDWETIDNKVKWFK